MMKNEAGVRIEEMLCQLADATRIDGEIWRAAYTLEFEKFKLGLKEDGMVEIINVKCEPDMVGLLTQTYGFLPGYHMNKKYWITMLLDGSVSEAKILDFLDMSYDLIDRK